MSAPQSHLPTSNRMLGASIAVILLASSLASFVQTSGGRVTVQAIKLPTQNGQWVVADLFKPKSATREAPAPLVVVVPGAIGNRWSW